MMISKKTQAFGENASTWGRFLDMVRRTGRNHSLSGLEFYTHSVMPALLTLQASLKQEQL